jgi:hypothetical protein
MYVFTKCNLILIVGVKLAKYWTHINMVLNTLALKVCCVHCGELSKILDL